MLKKFHKQFLNDMNEHITESMSNNEHADEEGSSEFSLKIRFMMFYFKVSQQFLLQFTDLHEQIMSTVINFFGAQNLSQPNSVKILTPDLTRVLLNPQRRSP